MPYILTPEEAAAEIAALKAAVRLSNITSSGREIPKSLVTYDELREAGWCGSCTILTIAPDGGIVERQDCYFIHTDDMTDSDGFIYQVYKDMNNGTARLVRSGHAKVRAKVNADNAYSLCATRAYIAAHPGGW